MTRSAHSAVSLPPPTHQPCTCAMTGFGARHMLMNFCVVATACAVAQGKVFSRIICAIGRNVLVPKMEALAEIIAGAKRTSGAAQNDDFDRGVLDREIDRGLEFVRHGRDYDVEF